ncbi:MAG: hypothetical protein JXL97_01735 [Bacteroidales bacterium]|nr:hypothetical protein [Bacteroidales bacterium]
MKKLSNFFYKNSNIFIVIFLATAMVLYASFVMGKKGECITNELSNEYQILGLKVNYDVEYVQNMFESVSKEALECYSTLLTVWDNIFPAIYGLMYVFLLSIIYKNINFRNKTLRAINLFPIIPAVLDWVENFYENKLVTEYILSGIITENLVKSATNITQIKWTFSLINYIIIIVGFLILLKMNADKAKKQRNI